MTNPHTPADPLDEAIEAATNAAFPGLPEYMAIEEAYRRITAAVRAAAPIIAAPIQAERDALAATLDEAAKQEAARLAHETAIWRRITNYDDPPDVRIDFLIAEATAAADLRARLATAERERDELLRLVDFDARQDFAKWQRERAKEASGE